MDERSFWVELEFRLCREFAGLPERRYQYFWCDGLLPCEYLLNDARPRITGKAWIGNSPHTDQWDFVLLLPRSFKSRDEIEWDCLLPPEDMTGWMAFDLARRYIEIEPAVAAPEIL